jgi:regulator of RNase E activity RraA
VRFGGVTWTPGHYVYVDEDGVVVAREMLHDAP